MTRSDRRPRRRLPADVRRDAILHAAGEAFAVAPYDQVVLADIAAATDSSEALVHRYFASKAALFTEVVERMYAGLLADQRNRVEQLPVNTSARDRVRTALEAYLDFLATAETGWAARFLVAGAEPAETLTLRREIRAGYVKELAAILGTSAGPRDRYAVSGYFGFVDGACLAWVEGGCPCGERHALMDACLGALEGALGDWRR